MDAGLGLLFEHEHPEISSTWASTQVDGTLPDSQDWCQPRRGSRSRMGLEGWRWEEVPGEGWRGADPAVQDPAAVPLSGAVSWGSLPHFLCVHFSGVCPPSLLLSENDCLKARSEANRCALLSHNFGRSGLWRRLAERMSGLSECWWCGKILNPQRWSALGLRSKFPFL